MQLVKNILRFTLGFFIGGLLAMTLCHAASTDTVRDSNDVLDVLNAKIAALDQELIDMDNQEIARKVAKAAEVPVEQKVVEIHMTRNVAVVQEESKKDRKKRGYIEVVPLPGHGTCSGSFIGNEGEILTAKHCVDGFDAFEVQTFDGELYTATVIATSTAHDLAIIRIDRNNTPYFELAKSVSRGETITILGSPLGITDTLSTGVVAKKWGDLLLLDCSALPGNSGGPVFNQRGELVGVLNAGFIVGMGVTHLNMAQGLDTVHFFIKEVAYRYRDGRR